MSTSKLSLFILKSMLRHARLSGVNVTSTGRLFLPNTRMNPLPVVKQFHTSSTCDSSNEKRTENPNDDSNEEEEDDYDKKQRARRSALSTQTFFDSKERNKATFEAMLDIYKEGINKHQRGVVEFIHAAINHLDDYNVSYDLDIYKKIIQLLPEGKYVAQNMYQAEFYHYPKQQDCIVAVLEKMESKGVCPDKEMVDLLKRMFGERSGPVKKAWRQLYWFPKFKNANPWPVPFPPISDRFLLTKIAIERIVSVDAQSVVSVWETKSVPDAVDDTYIVSGQSPTQQKLLAKHPTTKSLYIEGPFHIWIGRACLNYFILRADAEEWGEQLVDPDDVTNIDVPYVYQKSREVIEKRSVHEQQDGTILAVNASGTSSRDALLSWIRLLEKNGNPALEHIPVIFSLKAPVGEVTPFSKDGPLPNDDPQRVTDQ